MDEFRQLYVNHEKQIFKYLLYLTGDKFIAEELTQETFYQAFKSIHRFKGKCKISTWLFQIAKHTFYSHLKKNKKVEPLADYPTYDHSNLETPENIYEKKEESMIVFQAIRRLKAPQREIIILLFITN
ncbi:RNA polymerase sigma factor [Lysinibacillus fusiformis]|nr:RNA polymerase sigma factor [Lysinibacillus fusiformis]